MIRHRYERSIGEIDWGDRACIDIRYGLMIWVMIVSIQSSFISIWDIFSHWCRSKLTNKRAAAAASRGALLAAITQSDCTS